MHFIWPMTTVVLFISFFDVGKVKGSNLEIQVTRKLKEMIELKENLESLQKDIEKHISSFFNNNGLLKLDSMVQGLANETVIRINFGKKIDSMLEAYGQQLADLVTRVDNIDLDIENRLLANTNATEVSFLSKLEETVSTIEHKCTESMSKLNQTLGNLYEQINQWRVPKQARRRISYKEVVREQLYKVAYDVSMVPAVGRSRCRVTFDNIHGGWTAWGSWTRCTSTCGKGVNIRVRTCTNPAPANGGNDCVGDALEYNECQINSCEANGGWTLWGSWSTCSSSCGNDLRHRSRTCTNPVPANGGQYCDGQPTEYSNCQIQPCEACDCKGMSEECYFDEELYRQTGHGGHCKNCRNNTDGPHCERCKVNHYVDAVHKQCVPCGCDPIGSENLQCDTRGQCPCKPGVTGQRCSQCQDNYYDFGPYGCRECGCLEEGSLNNWPYCNPVAGMCTCKEHVEGQDCNRCKPGYFSLDRNNPYGCISCFCYGHSSICNSATGYYTHVITTDFETGKQRWTAEDRSNNAIETQYNRILQNLGVSAPSGTDMVYFVAPARYHGDQRFSYNQYLTYKLRIGEEAAMPSIVDIVIQSVGKQISAPYYAQNNPAPGIEVKEYRFRLHENPDYQWYPQLTSEGFISILSNITAIKIRATYNKEGVGFIDDIKLETAKRGLNGGSAASWVEQCTCPDGYVGQFCESCAPGYRREPSFGGPYALCIPCQCYNHSDQCDPQSAPHCGDGWTQFQASCYTFVHIEMSWFAAEQYCQGFDSHLIHIDNYIELQFIRGKLYEFHNTRLKEGGYTDSVYWTAGNDIRQEGRWVLSPLNVPMKYMYWFANEPNNDYDGENCVDLAYRRLFQMNDLRCNLKGFVICEIDRKNG